MNLFISYAEEDANRIAPVCQALASWGLSYWTPPRGTMGAEQNAQIQRALPGTNAFLRICTSYTSRSYWMTFEQTALLALQAEEYRQTGRRTRMLINVILDKAYRRQPFDYADPVVEATDLQSETWREALRALLFNPVQ
ncbi:MAG: TIR domain-containing protein [Ktedonobacterales bacterium]